MNHRADIADNAHPKKKGGRGAHGSNRNLFPHPPDRTRRIQPPAPSQSTSHTHSHSPSARRRPPIRDGWWGRGGPGHTTPTAPPPTMSGWHPPPSNPPHRKGIGRREGAYARVCRRSQTELPISSVSQQRPRGGPDTCVTNPTHPPRGPTEDGGHEAPPRGPMEDGGLEPKCV